MLRLGFSGVPGSGKTSTARLVAAICRRGPGIQRIELLDEYARWYINTYGPVETVWEQVRILNKQLSREGKVPAETTNILLSDSPVFMSFAYALDLRREGNRKDAMVVSDMFKMMSRLNVTPHYDLIVHIPPVLKPVADGTRVAEQFQEKWRQRMDQRIRSMFDLFPPRRLITLHSVELQERAEEVLGVLETLLREGERDKTTPKVRTGFLMPSASGQFIVGAAASTSTQPKP